MTKLQECISKNDLESLPNLLQETGNDHTIFIDVKDFPEPVEIPLLSYASSLGNLDMVKSLIQHGVKDDKKFTAIRFIDGNNPVEMLNFLLFHNGVDNLKKPYINHINMDGHTPLSYAIRKGMDISYIEELLKRGADPNTPLVSFENEGVDYHRNPLQLCASRYDRNPAYFENMIKLLLLFGANPKLDNTMGDNAISIAHEMSKNEKLAGILEKETREILQHCNDEGLINGMLELFEMPTEENLEKSKKKLQKCMDFLRNDVSEEYEVEEDKKTYVAQDKKECVFSYKDGDEMYCFFRQQIPSIVMSGKNPHTDKKISKKVLDKWVKLYRDLSDNDDIKGCIKYELSMTK